LHIGTSSFTAAGWSGSFYPSELKPKEFLTYYTTKFNMVTGSTAGTRITVD
jgi:uncharacterized protein YecE (DUF72 family)